MKRTIYVVMAVLAIFAVFAFVSCDSGSSPGDKKVTISFDLNLGEDVVGDLVAPADIKVKKGGTIELPEIDGDLPTDYEFLGWSYGADDQETFATDEDIYSANTKLYAQWITAEQIKVTFDANYRGAPAPTFKVLIRATDKLTAQDLAAPARTSDIYEFDAWYTNAKGTGTAYAADTTLPTTGKLALFANWNTKAAPPPTGSTQDTTTEEIKGDNIEWVALENGVHVVYEFTLPEGAVWADYKALSADYKVAEAYWDVGNSARDTRLLGNYRLSDFQLVDGNKNTKPDTSPGAEEGATVPDIKWPDGKIAMASYNNGKNAPFILASSQAGDWKTVRDVVKATDPSQDGKYDEFFNITYKIDGSTKNGSYDSANLPDPNAKGPFFFAIGIAANGAIPGGTVQQIKNIKLVPNIATGDGAIEPAYGKPLYLKDSDGNLYPAFTGYPSASGADGVKEAYRSTTAAPDIPDPEVAAKPATADFSVPLTEGGIVNSVAFAGNYGSSDDLFVYPITFPLQGSDQLNASSYAKFTIEAEFYSGTPAEGTLMTTANGMGGVKWSKATAVANVFDQEITTTYNLGMGDTTNAGIPAGVKFYPSTFKSMTFQNNNADVKFIKIKSITFHKP